MSRRCPDSGRPWSLVATESIRSSWCCRRCRPARVPSRSPRTAASDRKVSGARPTDHQRSIDDAHGSGATAARLGSCRAAPADGSDPRRRPPRIARPAAENRSFGPGGSAGPGRSLSLTFLTRWLVLDRRCRVRFGVFPYGVVGCGSGVAGAGWAARTGMGGFRRTGREWGLRAQAPKPAADPGRGEPLGRGRSFPGPPEIIGEVPGQPKLGMRDDDQPGPAVSGGGTAELRDGPAQGLLEQPECVPGRIGARTPASSDRPRPGWRRSWTTTATTVSGSAGRGAGRPATGSRCPPRSAAPRGGRLRRSGGSAADATDPTRGPARCRNEWCRSWSTSPVAAPRARGPERTRHRAAAGAHPSR
jgi:hypothetical protein